MAETKTTKEGFRFKDDRLYEGLYTEATIPSTKSLKKFYDVIVIGAGFTGLTAARDLSTAGKSVLIIEARDRIGGRTWATKSRGHYMEMGGTWIYWTQPHVWSELKRYKMDHLLKTTTGTSPDLEALHFRPSKDLPFKRYTFEGSGGYNEIMETTIYKFLDVDGVGGTKLLRLPYNQDFVRSIPEQYLKMTVQERLDQLVDTRQEHKDLVASMFETIGCASCSVTPFFEILRWFGLSGFTFRGFLDSVDALSLINGTTSLALEIMSESKADILLSSPVASVTRDASNQLTTILTRSGKRFQAPKIICTLPVNCLGDVVFNPPLNPLKLAAAKQRHLTKVVKMHVFTKATLIPTFVASLLPAKISFGYTESDVHTPSSSPSSSSSTGSGGTFSVFFGSEDSLDRSSPAATFRDFKEILPEEFNNEKNPRIEPEEMFWHDWTNDEFAKGAWCTFPMGWQEGYLDALREDEQGGSCIFANADWADGWRGFIDGAFEMGRSSAWRILKADRDRNRTSRL